MNELKVYDNQTIIDVIGNNIGNLDCLYSSLLLNNLTSVENILDIDIPIKYEKSYIKKIYKKLTVNPRKIEKKTYDNQSVFDVYLQFNNNFDGFYNFLDLNNFNSNYDLNLEIVIISSELNSEFNKIKYCTKVGEPIMDINFLLLENSSYVKQENDYKIIIN